MGTSRQRSMLLKVFFPKTLKHTNVKVRRHFTGRIHIYADRTASWLGGGCSRSFLLDINRTLYRFDEILIFSNLNTQGTDFSSSIVSFHLKHSKSRIFVNIRNIQKRSVGELYLSMVVRKASSCKTLTRNMHFDLILTVILLIFHILHYHFATQYGYIGCVLSLQAITWTIFETKHVRCTNIICWPTSGVCM